MRRPFNQLPRFAKFAVSGIINTAIDFSIFAFLLHSTSIQEFGANLIAFGTAVISSFFLNRSWTFADRQSKAFPEFVLWMSAIALSSSWLIARLGQAGMSMLIAKPLVTLCVIGVSFLAMNRLVFDQRRRLLARWSGVFALICAVGLNIFSFAIARVGTGLPAELRALYTNSPAIPENVGLKVYHLGHSLVGRDMPAMLAQLAGSGHSYGQQLGWGTSINQHLEGKEKIFGFVEENAHPRFVPLETALADTSYNVLVFTEMIGLREAIKYHNSSDAVTRLVQSAKAANPDLHIALYETWHPLSEGDWLERILQAREEMWEPDLLAPAIRAAGAPVTIVPAGSVMARLVEQSEARSAKIKLSRHDLFSDDIHLNDLGNYLVALTHYASLYRRSPEGKPHQLLRADGSAADAPSQELARLMQQVVWEVVSASPLHR